MVEEEVVVEDCFCISLFISSVMSLESGLREREREREEIKKKRSRKTAVTIRHVFKMDFKFSFGLWSIYNVRNILIIALIIILACT